MSHALYKYYDVPPLPENNRQKELTNVFFLMATNYIIYLLQMS